MNSADFLDESISGRRDWDSLLASIPPERLTEPNAVGFWSLKDLIAHVTWYEREMVGVIRERTLVGPPYWELPLDERNAAIYEEFRDQSLAEIQARAAEVWESLLPQLDTLTDEDLVDPSRIANLADWIPGVLPWQMIASNTFEHYADHTKDVQAWLSSAEQPT